MAGALGELELEFALCPFLPWNLVEQGTEWSLATKSELLELLSGVRKLPGISSDTLTDEAKAVLLVVIGYRQERRGFTDPDWGDSGPRGSSLP